MSRTKKGLALLLAVVFLLALLPMTAIAAEDAPPRLKIYTYHDMTKGDYERYYTLTGLLKVYLSFDQTMSLTPGVISISGGAVVTKVVQQEWSTDFYAYIGNWNEQTQYYITVSGFKNAAGIEMEPTTVPLKILQFKPNIVGVSLQGNAVDPATKTLSVTWDVPVWPISGFPGDGMVIVAPIQYFSPTGEYIGVSEGNVYPLSTGCQFFHNSKWENPENAKYTHIYGPLNLQPNTKYGIYVGRHDADENLVEFISSALKPNFFTFTTSGPSQTAVTPQISKLDLTGTAAKPYLAVYFNTAMSFQGRVRLDDTTLSLGTWNAAKTVLTYTLPSLVAKHTYTLRFDGSFASSTGGTLEPCAYQFEIKDTAQPQPSIAPQNPSPSPYAPPASSPTPTPTKAPTVTPAPAKSLGKGKTTSAATIFEKAGNKGKKLGTVAKGGVITVLEISGSSAKVTAGKITGYIPLKAVNVKFTTAVTLALLKQTKVYSSSAASAKNLLATLAKGAKVSVIGRYGAWWVINYKGKNGYIADASLVWPK